MNEELKIDEPAGAGLRWAQFITAVLLSWLFIAIYGGSNWIASQRAHVGTLAFAWEHRIPFVPLMILPYMSIDLLFVVAPFLCRTKTELATYRKRIMFAILVAGTFFLLMPLRLTFRQPVVTGWLGAIFAFLHGFDQPHNLFPSLHIAQLMVLASPFTRHTRGLTRRLLQIWFGLICFSTVLTYQHHVLDVAGGFILAAFCFYVFRENPLGPPARKNVRVGRLYGLGALALLALVILGWPWLGILLWPAGALALASAAYFGLLPALYRKENGRIPLASRWVMGPLMFGEWVSLRYHQRKCRPWDEIVPGAWLGRKLTARESRQARNQGVRAVLDVTAEFSETPEFLAAAYLNLPILDLTTPTPAHLERGARFIGEQRAQGTVYIHCMLGFSRSAVMLGAYLIQSGAAKSAREAMALIREKRPAVIFRKEAAVALEEFRIVDCGLRIENPLTMNPQSTIRNPQLP